MIDIKLRLTLFVIIMVCLFLMVNMIRKNKLELKYALLWLLTGFLLILLLMIPSILFSFASLIGIEIPTNLLFTIGMLFLLVLTFALTISHSRNSRRIRTIAQELAVLKLSIEEQSNKSENTFNNAK